MQSQKTRARMRTGLAAVGVAALLVGGLNIASDAAGSAKPLLLGKSNKAKKTTSLTNKKAGPVLALKAKSGPALSVNTTDLIANLNSDQLDGKTLEQVSPTLYTVSIYTPGQTTPASAVYVQTTSLPAGKYRVSLSGLFDLGSGESATCQGVDYTRFVASGGADFSSFFIANLADETPDISALGYADVVAGHQLVLFCQVTPGNLVYQPAVFAFEAIDRIAPVPGQGPFTPRPGVAERLNALR